MSNFTDLRSRIHISIFLITAVVLAILYWPVFFICVGLVIFFVTRELFPGSTASEAQRKIVLRTIVLAIIITSLLAMSDIYIRNPYDVAFIIACASLSDSGCYFAGRLIGGPKLPASISANKTYAGLCGGFALVNLVYCATINIISPYITHIFYGHIQALILAAILGDLLESKFKRLINIKDMSSLLAGHGGVLDRADSTILTTLAFWMITR